MIISITTKTKKKKEKDCLIEKNSALQAKQVKLY